MIAWDGGIEGCCIRAYGHRGKRGMFIESDPIMMTVDGQDFRVRVRAGEPGVYDFDWLSGPHDYGFMSATSDRSAMSVAELEESIRGFLAQIDPVTGYIE